MSDDDDDQSPQDERQRQRSRSRGHVHPYATDTSATNATDTSGYKRHQYSQWLSKSRLQYLMKTLVAPEDDEDPDRENEHLNMYR